MVRLDASVFNIFNKTKNIVDTIFLMVDNGFKFSSNHFAGA